MDGDVDDIGLDGGGGWVGRGGGFSGRGVVGGAHGQGQGVWILDFVCGRRMKQEECPNYRSLPIMQRIDFPPFPRQRWAISHIIFSRSVYVYVLRN